MLVLPQSSLEILIIIIIIIITYFITAVLKLLQSTFAIEQKEPRGNTFAIVLAYCV